MPTLEQVQVQTFDIDMLNDGTPLFHRDHGTNPQSRSESVQRVSLDVEADIAPLKYFKSVFTSVSRDGNRYDTDSNSD